MKNKLYTKSYFSKRIKEKGFKCEVIYDSYNPKGIRYWTVIVDSGGRDIMITCVKKSPTEYYFLGSLDSVNNYVLNTHSMDVIINLITNLVKGPEIKQELA
jgi:hypothetical protein